MEAPSEDQGKVLARFFADAGQVAILTGAGVSTASGIPEYRDRDGNWKHPRPVQYADFLKREQVRRRYWARSFVGWRRMSRAAPNDAHAALAGLERAGFVGTTITQNVDGLHQRAGSERVIDLHGRLDTVRCLDCRDTLARDDWQHRLLDRNPGWRGHVTRINPDGDAELADGDYAGFSVPACETCGGIMKPDVVFFGESVPPARVAAARAAVDEAGALVVVGSSLMVFSGLRFARHAEAAGKPIAIVNQGRTRADDLAAVKIEADCGELLARTLDVLSAGQLAASPGS
jgi:NAD-dependent SIR2 family protein deacetylase